VDLAVLKTGKQSINLSRSLSLSIALVDLAILITANTGLILYLSIHVYIYTGAGLTRVRVRVNPGAGLTQYRVNPSLLQHFAQPLVGPRVLQQQCVLVDLAVLKTGNITRNLGLGVELTRKTGSLYYLPRSLFLYIYINMYIYCSSSEFWWISPY